LARIEDYKNLFGEENYYIELLYHDDIPKQNFITDKLIELVNKYDLNAVAANNCYYISEEDRQTQDVIMAL
jgi:DNA polymerase III alpha subunit